MQTLWVENEKNTFLELEQKLTKTQNNYNHCR